MGTAGNQPTQAAQMPMQGMGALMPSPVAPRPLPTTAPAAPLGPNIFEQAQRYQTQAGQTYGNLARFQAPEAIKAASVSSGGAYDPTAVEAGTLAATNYQQYMNPYTQQVIERGEQDIARQREQALNALGAAATAGGAFGGSRFGLAEGETYGQYGRMAADLAAQQRQRAFEQAQQAATFDISKQYEAARANEAARQAAFESAAGRSLSASQASAANQMQAALANQRAAFDAARLQQSGAAGLAGLGQQAFGMGQSIQQAIGQQGALQRSLQQQMIDRARGQYAGATGAPLQGLGILSQILGSVPYGTTTTARQGFNPATLAYLI